MPFAQRIQIDLTDGEFAPTKSVELDRIWWDERIKVDIHLMYQRPVEYLAQLISLKPSLVIIHFEADVDHRYFADSLRQKGIKAGLALLKETPASDVEHLLKDFDHVLIFSGDLGKFGGQADLSLLDKISQIKSLNPAIEIGWDGGANQSNAAELTAGGVDVLNVGGAIQKADDPQKAYQQLLDLI